MYYIQRDRFDARRTLRMGQYVRHLNNIYIWHLVCGLLKLSDGTHNIYIYGTYMYAYLLEIFIEIGRNNWIKRIHYTCIFVHGWGLEYVYCVFLYSIYRCIYNNVLHVNVCVGLKFVCKTARMQFFFSYLWISISFRFLFLYMLAPKHMKLE